VRESHDNKYFELRPSISKESTFESDNTIGRTVRLCGDIGVITKFADWGKMIGPPQLNEYAVEPVGVATISPSAQYEFSNSPLR
jgi:hypothetical protein